jgi:hypothetical protein
MARQAKDIAKRLRFHLFPRPDTFRRWYLLAGSALALAAVALWVAFASLLGEKQYLPGPVSASHATFGEKCERCHQDYRAVANGKCLACHAPRVHSKVEVDTPACRDCHVEHRDGRLALSVATRSCVDCHAALRTTRAEAVVATAIRGFADHPEFGPLREGRRDEAAVRFNHRIHLTSDKIPKDQTADGVRLRCPECHAVADDGRYMRPIVFEKHCRRCHEQKVKEAPSPIGDVEVPHEDPATIRDAVAAELVALAVARPREIFLAPDVLLPGRAVREPVSDAATLREYRDDWLAFFEQRLYRPLDETTPLLENNKYCFLCHLPGEGEAPAGLPVIAKTEIPRRWLARGEFAHRKHDKLPCATCHPDVEKGERTAEVHLPGRDLCLKCHVDDSEESAGASCTLCHLYHDTSKHPELRKAPEREQTLDALLGLADAR